jgi:general secretion pathway protein L
MPTSATEPAGGDLLLFAERGTPAMLGGWRLFVDGEIWSRGEAGSEIPAARRVVLAVPGEEVSLHWLDLAEDLAPAQAAAAARLMLADASAEPLSAMHVAVGRAERGRTAAALVSAARIEDWLAAASLAGIDVDAIVPEPLLLAAPEAGFLRRDQGELADFRGQAAAFTLEPEFAEPLVGDAAVAKVDEGAFEAALAPQLAAPMVNLRQGPYARRRQLRVERRRLRRIALFAIVLAVLSLAVQIATILAYTYGADRLEAQAEALAPPAGPADPDLRPPFGAVAAALFAAVQATPQAEIFGLDYRADGTLVATVTADNPATLTALQERLAASGLSVTPGESRTAGGRMSSQLTLTAG